MGLGDYLVIVLVVGPYIFLAAMWVYDHTEYGRKRRIKGMPEELIQIFIDANPTYFADTINIWLEVHNKRIENGKIVTNALV